RPDNRCRDQLIPAYPVAPPASYSGQDFSHRDQVEAAYPAAATEKQQHQGERRTRLGFYQVRPAYPEAQPLQTNKSPWSPHTAPPTTPSPCESHRWGNRGEGRLTLSRS
ncbi:unnamed protein product, partial [Fusarium graminearum]